MDLKKTRHQKAQKIIGLGAFQLINLTQFMFNPFWLHSLIINIQKMGQQHLKEEWYENESTNNKLSMLKAYQMSVHFETHQQQVLQDIMHESITKVKGLRNIIDKKVEYEQVQKQKLQRMQFQFKKLQLRIMEKRYKIYHEKLFPSNPLEILRNQIIINDDAKIVSVNEHGSLVLLPNQKKEKPKIKRKQSLNEGKGLYDIVHNPKNTQHYNPYQPQQHHRKVDSSKKGDDLSYSIEKELVDEKKELVDGKKEANLIKNTQSIYEEKQKNMRMIQSNEYEQEEQKNDKKSKTQKMKFQKSKTENCIQNREIEAKQQKDSQKSNPQKEEDHQEQQTRQKEQQQIDSYEQQTPCRRTGKMFRVHKRPTFPTLGERSEIKPEQFLHIQQIKRNYNIFHKKLPTNHQ